MFKIKLSKCYALNKDNKEYCYLCIEVVGSIGSVCIRDFTNVIPIESMELDSDIIRNDKGRYIIEALEYYIPYQYNLAFKLLVDGELRKENK